MLKFIVTLLTKFSLFLFYLTTYFCKGIEFARWVEIISEENSYIIDIFESYFHEIPT